MTRPPTKSRRLPLRLLSQLVMMLAIPSSLNAREKLLFPRAQVTREDIQEAIRTEWELRKHYDAIPSNQEAWFKVLQGNAKVLISAPHATAQMRENNAKPADAGTGSLAVMLHKLGGATAIYTTYRSPSDPNFYDDNDYKRELRSLIARIRPKLVIDLHASHGYRPYDVDFGTLNGTSLSPHQNWLRRFADFLSAAGVRNFSQDFFAASKNETVTKFVRKLGVPCIQMEINEIWLDPFEDTGLKLAGDSEPTDIADDRLRIDEEGAHRFAGILEALLRSIAWVESQP